MALYVGSASRIVRSGFSVLLAQQMQRRSQPVCSVAAQVAAATPSGLESRAAKAATVAGLPISPRVRQI